MIAKRMTLLVAFLAAIILASTLGCANAFSEERNRRRLQVIRMDLEHMVDDIDWVLGLDEPSVLYEDSFPP